MDLDGVRTFVAAADAGQFQEAAATLSTTQQAVSKRIAALEKDLDVRLFTRAARGARLTIDGQAFLPHARELLRVAERADASVRPGRRVLRVDVVNRRIAPAVLLQLFYRMHSEIELDVLTLNADVDAAVDAVGAGTIDATFHAVPVPAQHLPAAIKTARVIDDPHQLLVGPGHALANAHAGSTRCR
jgi:DNA-binding transcriptional LysR family regulator